MEFGLLPTGDHQLFCVPFFSFFFASVCVCVLLFEKPLVHDQLTRQDLKDIDEPTYQVIVIKCQDY